MKEEEVRGAWEEAYHRAFERPGTTGHKLLEALQLRQNILLEMLIRICKLLEEK